MKGTLIIFILTVASSYSDGNEELSTDRFDVIEWWITSDSAYRLKTFALDNDIHVHRIEGHEEVEKTISLSKSNTDKTYGDVLKSMHQIEVTETDGVAEIQAKLAAEGLEGTVEVTDFIFWNPDGQHYQTASTSK